MRGLFSSCREGGYSLDAGAPAPATVASLVAAHGLYGEWASVVVVRGLSCPAA